MGFLTGGTAYVVAALVFVCSLGAAAYGGWHQRDRLAVAESERVRADAEKAVADAQAQAAEVSEKVVIQYKDRIVKIREIPEDVKHDVQIIRESDCRLPPEFLRVYNDSIGSEGQSPIGANDSAACADAIETLAANSRASRENAEQLKALQAWASGVSSNP